MVALILKILFPFVLLQEIEYPILNEIDKPILESPYVIEIQYTEDRCVRETHTAKMQ